MLPRVCMLRFIAGAFTCRQGVDPQTRPLLLLLLPYHNQSKQHEQQSSRIVSNRISVSYPLAVAYFKGEKAQHKTAGGESVTGRRELALYSLEKVSPFFFFFFFKHEEAIILFLSLSLSLSLSWTVVKCLTDEGIRVHASATEVKNKK